MHSRGQIEGSLLGFTGRPCAEPRGARGFSIESLFGSTASSRRWNVFLRRGENLLPVHRTAGALRSLALRRTALPVRAFRMEAGGVRPSRSGDEIRKQLPGPPGGAGARFGPIGTRAALEGRPGPLFEHPAGKERQRRLLQHLVQEHGKLPAKVCHVFQFGHFEISQGRVGTFPKIVHRRSAAPSHAVSPGAETAVPAAARRWRVTDSHISTSLFSAVEIPSRLGGRGVSHPTLNTGFVNSAYV